MVSEFHVDDCGKILVIGSLYTHHVLFSFYSSETYQIVFVWFLAFLLFKYISTKIWVLIDNWIRNWAKFLIILISNTFDTRKSYEDADIFNQSVYRFIFNTTIWYNLKYLIWLRFTNYVYELQFKFFCLIIRYLVITICISVSYISFSPFSYICFIYNNRIGIYWQMKFHLFEAVL